MRITAVLTVKNEGAFLLDWLAYHCAVGITDFLVFSNDCSDGTDRMLDRLQDMGWLTHVPNPGPHEEGPQWAALKQADRHPLVRGATWLMALDIDEYINIHAGDRTLSALLDALPEATAIPLTWRMFGNPGILAHPDRPVTEAFTRAAPDVLHWPWRAQLFKTLFRNDGSYRKLGVHRPRSLAPGATPRWYDGSGQVLPDSYHSERIFLPLGQDHGRLAQLNHYALGAVEDFLVKCDRGRSNREGSATGLDYWVERNFCAVEDRTILALDCRAPRAELRGDPVLAQLQAEAVAWRQARFQSLMQHETWRALYGRLLMTPPSRLLSPAEAESIWKRPRTTD